jgi:hypothetical protein
LIGLFGTAWWAVVFGKWGVFVIFLITYLLIVVNIWWQGRELWTQIKQNRNFNSKEEEE